MLVSMLVNLSHHCTSAIPRVQYFVCGACVAANVPLRRAKRLPSESSILSSRVWFRMQHSRIGCLHATLIRFTHARESSSACVATYYMYATSYARCQVYKSHRQISGIGQDLESAVDLLISTMFDRSRALSEPAVTRFPGSCYSSDGPQSIP